MAAIILVQKSVWQLFELNHYLTIVKTKMVVDPAKCNWYSKCGVVNTVLLILCGIKKFEEINRECSRQALKIISH